MKVKVKSFSLVRLFVIPWTVAHRESEKAGLKLNIQKSKIMASGPITSWQIDGKAVETVRDFIFGGSKITADSDCSHEIKRCLLLGRKVMTNLDIILKSRDILSLSCIFSILVSRLFICDSILISRFWINSLSLFGILYQVDSLSLPLWFGLVGIYPVPLSAGYSSVSSSCLNC